MTLLVGSLVQLVLPLLAQMMVDKGIGHKNIPLVYLILGGQLVLVLGSAAMEFVRNRLLLFVGMHVNISLITDFFAKLFRLPISFFETRTTGDLLQRIVDHRRVQDFLTGQVLSVLFSVMVFVHIHGASCFHITASCSLSFWREVSATACGPCVSCINASCLTI